jgi:hypothetical protein
MAIKNNSNSQKTVKSTLKSIPGDFWTIDSVSMFCSYKGRIVVPDGIILDDYRDYFENFLEDAEVPESMFYSPSLFSELVYGTPDLDFLVLYFAKMSSLFEFNESRIKVLPLTSLLDLNKLIVEMREEVRESKSNPNEIKDLEDIAGVGRGYL